MKTKKISEEKLLLLAEKKFSIVGGFRYDGANSEQIKKFVENSGCDFFIEENEEKRIIILEFSGGDITQIYRGQWILRHKSGQLLILGNREFYCLFNQ